MTSKKSDPLNRPVVQVSHNEVERALESFPSSTKPFDTRLDKRISRYGSQFNFGALDISKAVEIYPELAGGDTAIENNKGGVSQATPSKIESAPVTKSGSRKSHQPSELTLKRLKLAAYRFLCRHEEVRLWLQDVFSISIGADLIDRLKSGVMLCELINQIQDKLIPKINKKTSIAYFAMENIELFLRACAQLGVMRDHLFMPTDLYEEKNLPKVINCLVQLEEAARKKGFTKHIQPINELSMDFTEVQLTKASELVMIAEGFDEENKPSVDISIEEVRNLIKLEKMEELEKNGKTQLLAELVAEVDSEPTFEQSLERVEEEHRTLKRDEEPAPEVKVETLEEKESATETVIVEKVEEVVKEEAVHVDVPKVEVEEAKEVIEPPKEPEPQPVEEQKPQVIEEKAPEPPKEPEVVPAPVVEEPKPVEEPPVESPKAPEPPKEEEPLEEPEIVNMEKVEITELDGQKFKPDKGDKVDEMLARWMQEKKFGKQIKKIAWGKYMFGNMKLTVRDINGVLMVRVGGGWMKLDDFIKKNQHLLFKSENVENKIGKSASLKGTRSSSFLDHLTAPLSRTPRSRSLTASADSTKSTPIRKVERKPSTLKRPASAPAKPHRRSFSEPSTPKKPPPSFQMHTVSSLMKSPSLPNISTVTSSKGSRSAGNPLGKSRSVSSVSLAKQKS